MKVRFLNPCAKQTTDDLAPVLEAISGGCCCSEDHGTDSIMFFVEFGNPSDPETHVFIWIYDGIDDDGRDVYLGCSGNKIAFTGWPPRNPDTWALLGGIGAAVLEAKMGRRS